MHAFTRVMCWGRYDTFMQHDVQELNRVLVDKLEEKMNIQLSSTQNSAGGEVLKKEAKATTKLLYAVQAENGSQSSIESRLLPRF